MTTEGLGRRDNKGKPRWDLVPLDAVEEYADCLAFGATKYEERNWEKGLSWSQTAASLLRHLTRWMLGEDKDKESGLHHDVHIAFNAIALITFRIRNKGVDDRPKKP